MSGPSHTVVIQWSEDDHAYVASLPEWGPYCKAHGSTYEEAAKNAREVLELLMDSEDRAATVPAPKLFHYPGADVVDLPDSGPAGSATQVRTQAQRQTA